MRALLDVNVLIALLQPAHLHHRPAAEWLASHGGSGWASCPLTQNGCIRILSMPSYPDAQPAAAVAERLARAAADARHAFWADSISLVASDHVQWDRVLSARELTDCYLLALAVANGGKLVTFDRSIPLDAVPGAKARHLVRIG